MGCIIQSIYADELVMFTVFIDQTFGPRLLQLCNRALFECLALNLYCLRGEQGALTAVINNRIVSTRTIVPSTHTLLCVCKWLCTKYLPPFLSRGPCQQR